MPRRTGALTATILALAIFAVSACGVDVDSVKDATGTSAPATTVTSDGDTTTTTGGSDTTRRTTTTSDDQTATSGDEAAYVQAMSDSMTEDDEFPGTEKQARCFATKSIKVIGVDRLKKQGITPDDLRSDSALDLSDIGLTMDEGNKIYDAFEDCDFDLRGLMLDSMDDGEEVPAEAKECLDQVLTDDNLRKLMVTSIVKGDDAVDNDPALKSITAGLVGCMFMSMGSSTTTP